MGARLARKLATIAAALGVILIATIASPVAIGQPASPATPTSALPGVFSEIIVAASPVPVADPELTIGRVVLTNGAIIPPHEHPGTQVATILEGELTYTVLTGTVAVTGKDGVRLSLDHGETITLRPGDAVVEQPGAVHTARNEGSTPVVILLSTLFPAGAPRALYRPVASPQP